jgi:polygalacturonase
MSGGVHDIWVSNCSFTGTDIGLRFKSTRGRGGIVENINIENIRMIDIATDAISFNLFYSGTAPTESEDNPVSPLSVVIPEVTEETPEFKNITIRNVICSGADRAVQIMGLPEMPVNTIILENSVFNAVQGINCIFASNMVFKDLRISTKDSPSVHIWNSSKVDATSLSGNNETLFKIDGEDTKDILIKTENPEGMSRMLIVGEEINAKEIRIEGI